MGLMATDKGGSDFEPISQGLHHAICNGLYDLGTQFNETFGNWSHKVLICWELPEERIDIEKDGQKLNLPRATSKRYTLSLGEKANLRKDLETWRGKAFTAQELSGFDVKNILGKNCLLQIIHRTKGDKTYANVSAVMPLMKGTSSKESENPIRYFAFGDSNEIPEGVPEWITKEIQASKEWKARSANPSDPSEADSLPPVESYDVPEDDIPF